MVTLSLRGYRPIRLIPLKWKLQAIKSQKLEVKTNIDVYLGDIFLAKTTARKVAY